MNILCAVCGMEMETKYRSMSPGSNDPCLIVNPCCQSTEMVEDALALQDKIDSLRITCKNLISEIADQIKMNNLPKESWKEAEKWLRQFNAQIEDIL